MVNHQLTSVVVACCLVGCTSALPSHRRLTLDNFTLDIFPNFDHTTELTGPWIAMARYVVYVLTKSPINADFFRAIFGRKTHSSPFDILYQMHKHQPFVYQFYETTVVVANIMLAAALAVFLMRQIGTCGSSKEQDITINYRLLLQTYLFSACAVLGLTTFFAILVVSCDYGIDIGVQALEDYIPTFKDKLREYLDRDMIASAATTYSNMTEAFALHYFLFTTHFTDGAVGAVLDAFKKFFGTKYIFFQLYEKTFDEAIKNVQGLSSASVTSMKNWAAAIDTGTTSIKESFVDSLAESTVFQRHAIVILVIDMLTAVTGQLFTYNEALRKAREGIDSVQSVLLADNRTLFYIPRLKDAISKTITATVVFVGASMGGMLSGFLLGFCSHKERASPLERSATSNSAGRILVWTSYLMLFGVSVMTFLTGAVMLIGCIGEIFICRPQRDQNFGDSPELIDYATALLMNATEHAYYVQKLLTFSNIQQHCVAHHGIAGLAGIRTQDLQEASFKMSDLQKDLIYQYHIDLDVAAQAIPRRMKLISDFIKEFNNTVAPVAIDTKDAVEKLQRFVDGDLKLYKYTQTKPDALEEFVSKSFLADTLEKSENLKTDILYYLDQFDDVGNCTKILSIFQGSFNIMCNGVIDYVNGYWLALLCLTCVYVYAIYISLSTSKYFFIMESYTYEGEPVPEGTKFEDLASHRKQRTRRRKMDYMKDEQALQGLDAAEAAEEQRRMQELAEKAKALRKKKLTRAEEAKQDEGLILGALGTVGGALQPFTPFIPLLGKKKKKRQGAQVAEAPSAEVPQLPPESPAAQTSPPQQPALPRLSPPSQLPSLQKTAPHPRHSKIRKSPLTSPSPPKVLSPLLLSSSTATPLATSKDKTPSPVVTSKDKTTPVPPGADTSSVKEQGTVKAKRKADKKRDETKVEDEQLEQKAEDGKVETKVEDGKAKTKAVDGKVETKVEDEQVKGKDETSAKVEEHETEDISNLPEPTFRCCC
ncbi:uncharacterized protein LOC135400788 isoform X2 [Ornithodoros turicata]|uniref:uncharacterized protein LOC135400788 isoform X2 n=1 Tax=Ornithodoros turicata TaxID=34597 RepID=UPI003139A091